MFELKERDGLARICELTTHHGKVETPVLLPVINPNRLTFSPGEMSGMGVKMLITNSYIIRSSERLKETAEKSGVHGLLGFDGPIMTDSGTFQDHVYGDVRVDPQEIVKFQVAIGSDIGTTLDIFSEPEFTHDQAEEAVTETVDRARNAVADKGQMMLAGTVQGGIYEDLRQSCAEQLSKLGLDVHPIGGVVPLMESYMFGDLANIIVASKKGLDPSRPVHLFGAGHPMVFPMAVLLGCDMFDSASYAKFAREDRFMFPTGTRSLEDMHELACECQACRTTSADELKGMSPSDRTRIIARHNLEISLTEIRRIKNAIHEGSIWELVESRARAHPSLLEALKGLGRHSSFLERFEPAGRRGAFFYCGPESCHRPVVSRYQERFFARYRRPDAKVLVGFSEAGKPYARAYAKEIAEISAKVDAAFVVASFFGPVPMELDEYYPIAQSVVPDDLDLEAMQARRTAMERHAHTHGYPLAVIYDGDETLKFLAEIVGGPPGGRDMNLLRCKAVLDMQFGRGAADSLKGRRVEIRTSDRTGKIRNVLVDGVHAFSMRASDGRFTLKLEGGRLLAAVLEAPRMRVMVEDEPAEFAAKGNNVFAKFVIDADDDIRPGDDVLVVNSKGKLAAVGRAVLNREEMLAFKRGIAVRVKDSPE